MAQASEVKRLEDLARQLREHLLGFCGSYGGAVHIGGDLSMAEMLVALYHYGMKVDPNDIALPERDRFVLSKGHGAICMYIAMAMRGFFDLQEIFDTYGQVDSAFGMHPCKVQLPGVECSTGSLGLGLPMAVGMALSAKQKKQGHRVYCLLGDGETCEGSIWEAAIAARSFELGNLVVLIDRNRQMMTSFTEETIVLDPYPDKWQAFGWDTRVVEDGHSMAQLTDALDALPPATAGRPLALVCNTVKGKGVSFMERSIGWHAGSLSREDMEKALAEVRGEGGAAQ